MPDRTRRKRADLLDRAEFDGSLRADMNWFATRTVMDDQGDELQLRRCAVCRHWLIEADHFKQYLQHGEPRWHSRCHTCRKALNRKKPTPELLDLFKGHKQRKPRVQKPKVREARFHCCCGPRDQGRVFGHSEQSWVEAIGAPKGEQRRVRWLFSPVELPDDEAFPKVPVLQLGNAVHAAIDMESREQTGEPSDREDGPNGVPGNGFGPSAAVCFRLGICERTPRRWTRGEINEVKFDTIDGVIGRSDWLWWEIWNADTVRLPALVVTRWRMRDRKKGTYRERYETVRIGDMGTDWKILERVEAAFTNDAYDGDDDFTDEVAMALAA